MEEKTFNEEERVSRLLGNLPAAEAPENFEAMVRSQIAERRPSDSSRSPGFWLAMKFALPMLLLVLFGAFLVISDESSLDVGTVPPVDSPGVLSADLDVDEPPSPGGSNLVNASPVPRETNKNVRPAPVDRPSQEMALEQDDTTRFPPGVDPRRAVPNQKPPVGTRAISPLSILSFIGITSGCTANSCTVQAVQPASPADKSGIRVGDLIEAIDDRPIGSSQVFTGEVTVSSLRLVREGKRITIPLRVR